MEINQDNYEQFFLDHMEGNLSPEMEKELLDFLEANPDLKTVLDDFDASTLPTEELTNGQLKKRLKKNIHPTSHINEINADEWLIRRIEGLLNDPEENELTEFLSLNPAYGYDQKLYWLTKLVPDAAIGYRQKKELKKKVEYIPARRLFFLLPSAAAVILLFISIWFLNKPEVNTVRQIVASEKVPFTEIPASLPPDTKANFSNAEKQSIETPSETPSREIAVTFRLKPHSALEVVSFNQPASSQPCMAVSNIPLSFIREKRDKPLIAKVFSNMIAQAREGLRSKAKLDMVQHTDFNFWSVAKVGIDGFNGISDRELELYVRKDDAGKVKSYALLEQERLIWSKDLNNQ
jgi:hypothetical protein